MAQKAPLQIAGGIYDVFVKKFFVKKKKKNFDPSPILKFFLDFGKTPTSPPQLYFRPNLKLIL